jgi:hypothetical protein
LKLRPSFNLLRREGLEEESDSWALRSSRLLGDIPDREGEGEEEGRRGVVYSEAVKKFFDLGWGMVFRLATGVSGDSAKDTRLEES